MRELGDGGGLAAAVDADHQDHLRAREGGNFERLGHRAQDRGDFLRHRLAQLALGNLRTEALFAQRLAHAASGFGAEVRHDQRILDLVERGVVQPGVAPRLADGRDILAQAVGGLAKAAEQAVAPAGGALFAHASIPSMIRVGVMEAMVPGAVPSGKATRAKCGV